MTKLSKEFMSALPSAAEALNPSIVGKVISYASLREGKPRVNADGTTTPNHILCVKVDGASDLEIQAGAFNSLFFAKVGTAPATINAEDFASITNKAASVLPVVEAQPKWDGAAKGQSGIEKDAEGEGSFGSYRVIGWRIKTRDNVATFRSPAYKEYANMREVCDADATGKTRIDYNKLVASGVLPTCTTGTFQDLISREYLLVPVNA